MSELSKAFTNYQPLEQIKKEYRLYYEGETPIMITDEQPPGDYLVISADQFSSKFLDGYKVIDKKLYKVNNDIKCILRLILNKDGQFCTLPNNMMFVANEGDRYSLKEDLREVSSSGK